MTSAITSSPEWESSSDVLGSMTVSRLSGTVLAGTLGLTSMTSGTRKMPPTGAIWLTKSVLP